ncbi:MAG: hypothetical protein ABIR25_00405 [Sphingomicrobium sp.]
MKYARWALALFAVSAATSPALSKKAPQMSPLALQQMQTRDYEMGKIVSFPAVMTILQDSGYRIQAADKDTGLITATASTNSKMTWAPFVGFGRSKKTPVVSAFIEDRGRGSRVRLNFVMAKTKNGAYGASWSDEEPIIDSAVYRDAFERIDREVFTRAALNAPQVTPAPVANPMPSDSTAPAASTAASVPSSDNSVSPPH